MSEPLPSDKLTVEKIAEDLIDFLLSYRSTAFSSSEIINYVKESKEKIKDVLKNKAKYLHLKRGNVYTLEEVAIFQCRSGQLKDNSPVYIYRGADGQAYVRSVDEFNDGRFQKID